MRVFFTQWRQRAFLSSLSGKSLFQRFCERNGWLVAFIAYCFISIVWSDYPFITFKRCDQNFWSSDHGADRPYGTGSRRSADTVDEAMRLCGRPGFHSLDQILSSIGNELRRLEWHANNPGHRRRQKRAGCRLSDPGFLFLLAFAANLANRTEHSATKRASVDRRVLDRYLVAFETGAQCHIYHMSICSDTDSRVCRHPFYN